MSTSTSIALSIVVVSWNTRDLLKHCLDSVYATAGDSPFDVWVVDNASSDDSVAMVRACFPHAHLIENSANVGFARANNQGIQASRGEWVLLLNSDTLVQAGALQCAIEFMRTTPRAGIVGANILNPDHTPQRCFGKFPTMLSETIFAWGLDSRLPFDLDGSRIPLAHAPVETDWVLGAALMIRRDALNQVGLMDDGYFMYSEEVDWCYRVKRAGWKNFVLGDERIIHLGGQSTQQMPARMKAQLYQSKVRYFGKHHGAFAAWAMTWMFGASILGRRVGYALARRADAQRLWAEAWAHYVGAKQNEVGA